VIIVLKVSFHFISFHSIVHHQQRYYKCSDNRPLSRKDNALKVDGNKHGTKLNVRVQSVPIHPFAQTHEHVFWSFPPQLAHLASHAVRNGRLF